MTATLLDGRSLSKELQNDIQAEVTAFSEQYGQTPCLAVIQVEGDDASARYVRTIRKRCEGAGISFTLELLPSDVTQEILEARIETLSADPSVHGILIQMPLPKHIATEQAVLRLDYTKDVDGIHPVNAGLLALGRPALVPNTPAGGLELLRHNNIELAGRRAAMVGRSTIVGRPMAALLVQANATVTICHSYTSDLADILRASDIILVAIGRAGMITGDMVRPGAVVVDFGINMLEDGSMVGDVDFASVAEVASAITPVPGGTGPMTNAMLLRNVMIAARQQAGAA
jgi:methylenetetrahydrofolate dehydrogenase (NADP+)/methenyltetrahydrofolate cyclohydrolase